MRPLKPGLLGLPKADSESVIFVPQRGIGAGSVKETIPEGQE
jgi:hypothetical protein